MNCNKSGCYKSTTTKCTKGCDLYFCNEHCYPNHIHYYCNRCGISDIGKHGCTKCGCVLCDSCVGKHTQCYGRCTWPTGCYNLATANSSYCLNHCTLDYVLMTGK